MLLESIVLEKPEAEAICEKPSVPKELSNCQLFTTCQSEPVGNLELPTVSVCIEKTLKVFGILISQLCVMLSSLSSGVLDNNSKSG